MLRRWPNAIVLPGAAGRSVSGNAPGSHASLSGNSAVFDKLQRELSEEDSLSSPRYMKLSCFECCFLYTSAVPDDKWREENEIVWVRVGVSISSGCRLRWILSAILQTNIHQAFVSLVRFHITDSTVIPSFCSWHTSMKQRRRLPRRQPWRVRIYQVGRELAGGGNSLAWVSYVRCCFIARRFAGDDVSMEAVSPPSK